MHWNKVTPNITFIFLFFEQFPSASNNPHVLSLSVAGIHSIAGLSCQGIGPLILLYLLNDYLYEPVIRQF